MDIRWKTAQNSKSKIDASSTFCTVAKALDLQDLKEYRTLIESLPNINRYILFQENKNLPSGFLYSFTNLPFIKKKPKEKDNESTTDYLTTEKDGSDIIISSTLEKEGSDIIISSTLDNSLGMDGYEICYGNHTDINSMIKAFWPYILKYMNENPNHDHTKQRTTWIKNGMNEQATLNKIKHFWVSTHLINSLSLYRVPRTGTL